MNIDDIIKTSAVRQVLPVFRGLEGANVSGKEIAGIIGVSPPTVSKWRKGKARPSSATLVCLTLFLAHRVEEMERDRRAERELSMATGYWNLGAPSRIETVMHSLKMQESYNITLPAQAFREGARLFRMWWDSHDTHPQVSRPVEHPSISATAVRRIA